MTTDCEKQRRRCKADEIRELLEQCPRTTSELACVNHRFSACIHLLRQRGWEVREGRSDTGEPLWSLGSFVPRVDVTDDMKQAYYDSQHWKAKRQERLRFDDFSCCLCGMSVDLQVHHWRYDLFAEKLEDLATLCEMCHLSIHQNENIRIHFPHTVTPEIAEKMRLTCVVAQNA